MTQIRFTGEKDSSGRWLAIRSEPAAPTEGDRLKFDTLTAATDLAAAEGWADGVSLSSATYEAMLDAEAADPEGGQADNLTITDD